MKGITVRPGTPASARLEDLPEPERAEGMVLVQTLAIGVCGTDREILDGAYGTPPPGRERMVLGHESLGRVIDAPTHSGFSAGNLVAGIVRRPDPVPCASCAVGEWDMCRNGRYTEHGIKALDGFARERFVASPDSLVRVSDALGLRGVLLEPTSIVAKAWLQVERIGARAQWTPRRALVLGAGPVGLLAALLGVQRGLEVHVLDRVTEGPKPTLAARLGATYHHGTVAEACTDIDVVLECTGASSLVFEAMRCVAPSGIVCLAGVSSGHRLLSVDAGALNNELVLENNVVFGTVNANRTHYEAAEAALARADAAWLDALIARRVPLERWSEAYEPQAGDVKTIVVFPHAAAAS